MVYCPQGGFVCAPSPWQIFVGGLDPNIAEDELRQVFSAYGEILYVKIPFGKGCGFVQFSNRLVCAAVEHLNPSVRPSGCSIDSSSA